MSQQTSAKNQKTPQKSNNRSSNELQPSEDIVAYLKAYARAKPDVAALWCFGIGFVIGWKLKPW
ncbi:MAG: hypothetical protein DWQ45_23570 [Planctomycetota bacterium]|nr:MAG: hypothetical protein DWQ41_05765 [Planctomycetota bacterium]REK29124.1 MAG: hypothetical protein DWQ45_23570 [Planctomycetota bacterium]